jgi:hypothetical protein
MVKVALLVRLEAKQGKESAVAKFLENALPLADRKLQLPFGSPCVWGRRRSEYSTHLPTKWAVKPISQVPLLLL